MKYLTHLILASITINYACAQVALVGHEWNVTLKVVDETGKPIEGAKASVGYYSKSQPKSIDGLTDTNGIFRASHHAYSGILGFTAEKSGFYTTREPSYELGFTYDYAKWNPTQTIVLKRIGKPIPMYAKHLEGGPPIFNDPVGFDLMLGDWVTPNGKGQTTDIIFTGELNQKTKNDFDYKLTISFPMRGDGIRNFITDSTDKSSGLHSSHEAPADGYQLQVIRTMNRHPGSGTKEDMNDPNRNYYFRVRTMLDQNGNVKSALYGKIYGDFMQFSYYLNPTPNDRNVEFDPKQNLMKKLTPLEAVTGP